MRRITKELAELESDKESNIAVAPVKDDDLTRLRGVFPGPPETPYEGGTYVVDITIPSEYPFRPPQMRFETRLWHPNVSSVTGAICLDTLSSNWSPVLNLKSALLSLQSLLSSPEPKDPQDAQVAQQMIKQPEEFKFKAREWAIKYAGAPRRDIGESSGGASPATIRAKRLQQAKERQEAQNLAEYKGYNKDLIDRFCQMGFEVRQVVTAFEANNIDRAGGQDYDLEPAYIGDVTAHLFGEP
jgi:ubiquitin-conjugating enzyme (huntingtin interacting protein 2)